MATGTIKRGPIIKTGLFTTPSIASGKGATGMITFDTPMPDENYVVFMMKGPAAGFTQMDVNVDASGRTVNGFSYELWNDHTKAAVSIQYMWAAIHP